MRFTLTLLLSLAFTSLALSQTFSTTNKKAIKLYKKADEEVRTRQFDLALIDFNWIQMNSIEFN